MKKLLISVFAIGLATFANADVAPTVESLMNPKGVEVMTKLRKSRESITGGYLHDINSFKGRIVIVNSQDKLPISEIDAVVNGLVKATKLPISSRTMSATSPETAKSATRATLAIVVVNDNIQPTMLIAPEERWAQVNVSKLTSKREEDFAQRCRKEIIRAFSLLCGGGCSQYRGNLLDATTFSQIDLAEEMIPADVAARYPNYLASIGVTPHKMTTYKNACQEGWAPTPTNDVQKAIWNEVHQLPAKPVTIEYDPKRGK